METTLNIVHKKHNLYYGNLYTIPFQVQYGNKQVQYGNKQIQYGNKQIQNKILSCLFLKKFFQLFIICYKKLINCKHIFKNKKFFTSHLLKPHINKIDYINKSVLYACNTITTY